MHYNQRSTLRKVKYPPDSLRVLGKYEEMEKGKDDTYWKRGDALERLDHRRIP